MTKHPYSLLAVLLVPAILPGQGISGVVSPNPAPLGSPVTLTITEAQGVGITLPTSCTFQAIHAGTPTGTVIFNSICLQVLTPVGPCATRSQTFNPPPNLLQGTYWFEVRYWDQNFTQLSTEFFCVTYQASPGTPTLTAQTLARIGNDLVMSVNAPTFAGSPYIAAASFTTNAGFQINNSLYACLDLDFVFFLSFPVPDPTLFANFQGGLDNFGTATGITVHIPNLPLLLCKPLHVQVALPGSPITPPVALTNELGFTITQ